jgi:hypothetical protein
LNNKEKLFKEFKEAIEENYKYIAVFVFEADNEEPELIINKRSNFEKKLRYYMENYDEDLVHYQTDKIHIATVCKFNDFDFINVIYDKRVVSNERA